MACIYDDWVVLTHFKISFLWGQITMLVYHGKKKTFLYCVRNANTDMHTGTDLCSIIYGRLQLYELTMTLLTLERQDLAQSATAQNPLQLN